MANALRSYGIIQTLTQLYPHCFQIYDASALGDIQLLHVMECTKVAALQCPAQKHDDLNLQRRYMFVALYLHDS